MVTEGATKAALRNVTKKYYDNGNLKSIGSYDANGNLTGQWKFYNESGKLEMAGNNKNGKKNGNVESISTAKDNIPDGEWKSYYENGKLKKTDT